MKRRHPWLGAYKLRNPVGFFVMVTGYVSAPCPIIRDAVAYSVDLSLPSIYVDSLLMKQETVFHQEPVKHLSY